MLRSSLRNILTSGSSLFKQTASIDPDDVPKQHLKLVLCGAERVGKSKLFERIMHDTYSESYYQTIGSDSGVCSRIVPGANVQLEIWDTSGGPMYRSVLPIFFKKADIVAVVFDITNAKSFECVSELVTSSREWAGGDVDVAIFGTKIDSWKSPREVTYEQAIELAGRLDCRYFETSAVTTQGLEDSLRKLLKKALKRKRLLPEWLLDTPREEMDDELQE